MREEVDPTAARELSPANRPTTTISAALNKSCRILEHISGMANNKILPSSGPCTMSISCFFIIIYTSLPSATTNNYNYYRLKVIKIQYLKIDYNKSRMKIFYRNTRIDYNKFDDAINATRETK
jgi:hypothetical protein